MRHRFVDLARGGIKFENLQTETVYGRWEGRQEAIFRKRFSVLKRAAMERGNVVFLPC